MPWRHITGHPPPELDEVHPIRHQPARLHVIAPGIHIGKRPFAASSTINCRYGKSSLVLLTRIASGRVMGDFGEYPPIFGRCRLLDQHIGQRDFECLARPS